MKNLLPLFLFIVVSQTSCLTYQYIAIKPNSGNSNLTENKEKEFVVENDSIQIVYDFKGDNTPVKIKITNKLDKPLMIDWKRSAMIVNDNAVSYMPDEAKTTGNANTTSVSWTRSWSSSYSSFSSITEIPKDWQLVPPKSFVTYKGMRLTNGFIGSGSGDSAGTVSNVKIKLVNGYMKKAKEISFAEEKSPFRFRSYLTVLTETEGKIVPVAYESGFYVSGLLRPHRGPAQVDYGHSIEAKTSVAGGIITGVVTTAIVVVLAVAAVNNSE